MILYKELQKYQSDINTDELTVLFRKMYTEMYDYGLKTPLIENGENSWLASVTKLLGKINHIIIAIKDDKIIGFAHGNIRLSPEYQGGFRIGYITHVFVTKEYRNQKVASRMIDMLIEALKTAQAKRIDLDVLTKNAEAIKFWKRKGFIEDLYHMVKSTDAL